MHVQVLRGGGGADRTPSQHWCQKEVGGQQYTLAALARERPSTHHTGDWWTSGTVWTGRENLSTIRI